MKSLTEIELSANFHTFNTQKTLPMVAILVSTLLTQRCLPWGPDFLHKYNAILNGGFIRVTSFTLFTTNLINYV